MKTEVSIWMLKLVHINSSKSVIFWLNQNFLREVKDEICVSTGNIY